MLFHPADGIAFLDHLALLGAGINDLAALEGSKGHQGIASLDSGQAGAFLHLGAELMC